MDLLEVGRDPNQDPGRDLQEAALDLNLPVDRLGPVLGADQFPDHDQGQEDQDHIPDLVGQGQVTLDHPPLVPDQALLVPDQALHLAKAVIRIKFSGFLCTKLTN